MQTVFGGEQFYRLNSSLFSSEEYLWATFWYSEVGKEIYETYGPELANQLLDEIGYSGKEIIILTSRDQAYLYNLAVYIQKILNEVGLSSKIEEYDWGTYMERRNNPDIWDIFL